MSVSTISAAPPTIARRPPRRTGWIGLSVLIAMCVICLASLPWTMGLDADGARRFEATRLDLALLPPSWAPHRPEEQAQADAATDVPVLVFGTDRFGRDLFIRCLAGGGISLVVGLIAATIAVVIGTLYGALAASRGGRTDAVMMRIVDILYGLPTILLVVLLAVAADGWIARSGVDITPGRRQFIGLIVLCVAIGGVSWLTMARVIRGQVLALRGRPFMEACRAIGVPRSRQFTHHLLPNLVGPIVVYATLAVPAAILSESFLSFLGIGVQAPLPSWGTLVSDGLGEINPVRVRWWLLVWPCLLIAVTLLLLNLVGESLRRRIDQRATN